VSGELGSLGTRATATRRGGGKRDSCEHQIGDRIWIHGDEEDTPENEQAIATKSPSAKHGNRHPLGRTLHTNIDATFFVPTLGEIYTVETFKETQQRSSRFIFVTLHPLVPFPSVLKKINTQSD
jgi:hypothetical protein